MPNFNKFKEAVAEHLAAEHQTDAALGVLGASDSVVDQLARSAHGLNAGFANDGADLAAAAGQITNDPETMSSIMAASQNAADDMWGSMRQTPDSDIANAGISVTELVGSAAELAGEIAAEARMEGVQVDYLSPADVQAFVDSNPEVMGQLKDMLADKLEAQQSGQALDGFSMSDSAQFTMSDLFVAAAADQVQQATSLVYENGGSPTATGLDAYGQQVLTEALISANHGEISVEALNAFQEAQPAVLGGVVEALTESLVAAAKDGRTLDFDETVAAVAANFPTDSIVGESPVAAAEATSCFLECATRNALEGGELSTEQADFLRSEARNAMEQFDAQYDRGTYFVEQPATEAEIQALQQQNSRYDLEEANGTSYGEAQSVQEQPAREEATAEMSLD